MSFAVFSTIQGPVQLINHYLVDSVIGSPDTYPLDSDSFGG